LLKKEYEKEYKGLYVEVRNNNVEKALRVLKKKIQEDGIFNELRNREFHQTKGEKRRKFQAAGKRRTQRALQKRMDEQGY
jgi:small subunit ribosomal protein S21